MNNTPRAGSVPDLLIFFDLPWYHMCLLKPPLSNYGGWCSFEQRAAASSRVIDRGLTVDGASDIFAGMGEPFCDLRPPARGHGSRQLARLGNGLTGRGQLQGEAPRVERRLCPRHAGLHRTRLEVMRVRQEGHPGRGHQGGIQESLEGTRLLGVDLVEAIHRRVQPDARVRPPSARGRGQQHAAGRAGGAGA